MALSGRAAMVVAYDLEEGWESRHDHWHSHEHMAERVALPGFLRGRRYLSEGYGARCFVLYEADSMDALTSQAYLQRLDNPTPWSSQVIARFRNTVRTLCRVSVSEGRGIGGTMACVALSPQPSGAGTLREHLVRALSKLVAQPGVLAAHLLEGDARTSRIETREKTLRGTPDAVADWLLLVEGYAPLGGIVQRGPLARAQLLESGAASAADPAIYCLAAVLSRDEAGNG